MTDTEYQNLLAPASSMSEREAAGHYYNLAEQWYHLQNNKAFKAFSKHITRICKLLSSTDKNTRLDAVRALAFIAACPRLHRQLFENDVLKLIVYILGSSPEAANCEAALVVLNHLCTQSPRDQKHKFGLVTKFCNDKQSLIIIFRYAHVEDRCLSIIANVMSVLAALCTERPNIQEHGIRAGIMERAFNLKTSHRDRIVRTNVDLFLQAMQLQEYSVDKFNEMHTLMCINMGYSSRALCLGIWRLIVTKRFHDALKSNTLYTAVHQISVEDPTLDEDWGLIAKFIPNKNNEMNGNHNDNPNMQNGSHSNPSSPPQRSSKPKRYSNPSLINNIKSDPIPNENGKKLRNNDKYNNNESIMDKIAGNNNNDNNNNNNNKNKKQHNNNNNNNNNNKPNRYDDIKEIEIEEKKDDESGAPPFLIRNPSLIQRESASVGIAKLPLLHPTKSWLEKDVHIAILQTNPIESDDGGNLALNAERKRLQDIFFKTTRGLKIFFGVLTKDSLIRCIQRGAQIVHISGHGPYEKKLKVEDKYGRLEDLSANKIKKAIEKGGMNKKNGLKLVFVSTCYSEHVAESFCAAGVPHVVAVHSMVQILDQMATKFASAFYEALIAHKKTVEEAFNNSKAELLLEKEMDCCCRHEGHMPECRCPICKIYRCCSHHHGINSRCQQKKNISCCQPGVPHSHSDKFLLLPKNKKHCEQILESLPNARCERIDSRPPTNIGQPNQKIIGRARDTRILVDFLHPDNGNQDDAVFIYGRPKIGLTTVALQVARFFTRPWYQAIFLGGVFRINLQNCDDPNALYSYIAQAMNIRHVFGIYQYWDNKKKRYSPYPEQTQKDLHRALSGDDITDPIETFGDHDTDNNTSNPEHYIILDQHKNHKELLQYKLPPIIYREFEKRMNLRMLPMEFYIDPEDDNKVLVRRIKFVPPDEDGILLDIKKYGRHNNNIDNNHNHQNKNNHNNNNHHHNNHSFVESFESFEFQKLFIIDHINFPTPKIKQFLQKIKRLTENVKCKLLLVCHDRIEHIIHKTQQQDVANCMLKQRLWRIKPISKKDAAKLLLEQARQLYEFDFNEINTPSTAEETSQFPIFEWLAKSPALIQQSATVLDRKVPFCVIIKMLKEKNTMKWQSALNDWYQPLKLQQDELKDALNALTTLLTEINVVKAIWSDIIDIKNNINCNQQKINNNITNQINKPQ